MRNTIVKQARNSWEAAPLPHLPVEGCAAARIGREPIADQNGDSPSIPLCAELAVDTATSTNQQAVRLLRWPRWRSRMPPPTQRQEREKKRTINMKKRTRPLKRPKTPVFGIWYSTTVGPSINSENKPLRQVETRRFQPASRIYLRKAEICHSRGKNPKGSTIWGDYGQRIRYLVLRVYPKARLVSLVSRRGR